MDRGPTNRAHRRPLRGQQPAVVGQRRQGRGFAFPPGKKIHVKDCARPGRVHQGPADTGKWVMPVGTVMVKSFGFDGKLVETRLLAHPDATDVDRLQLPVERGADRGDDRCPTTRRGRSSFHTGTRTVDWHYPSRFDCTAATRRRRAARSGRRRGR